MRYVFRRITAALSLLVLATVRPLVAQTADVDSLGAQLSRGRLIVRDVRFTVDDRVSAASMEVVARLARALRVSPGVYLVEAREPVGAGGQARADRRSADLRSRLVSAGADSRRLFAAGAVAQAESAATLVISRLR